MHQETREKRISAFGLQLFNGDGRERRLKPGVGEPGNFAGVPNTVEEKRLLHQLWRKASED